MNLPIVINDLGFDNIQDYIGSTTNAITGLETFVEGSAVYIDNQMRYINGTTYQIPQNKGTVVFLTEE